MTKIFLAIVLLFLTPNSLTLADEKPKLPDYKKWSVFKFEPNQSDFMTIRGGCKSIDTLEKLKELTELDLIDLDKMAVYVGYDQYRSPTPGHSLGVIKDINGRPWLILYRKNYDIFYLFKKQRRFFIFGYKWKLLDTYEDVDKEEYEASVYRTMAFQLKHCLFYLPYQ